VKTVLQSDVELWKISAFAEVAVWERRPELQRVCTMAPERGLGPAEIDQALPGLSETARGNIIRYLNYLRLIDDGGALTALGRRCAATGEAPAWELGGYSFLVSAHPLFRCHVIAFRRAPGEDQDRDFQDLDDTPAWFRVDPGRIWTCGFDGDVKFTIHALTAPRGAGPKCRARTLPPARLVWNIDLDSGQNAWHIEGEVPGERERRRFRTRPESVRPESIAGMFAAWEKRWNPASRRVSMAYDGKARDGRETFLRTFRYPQVEAGGFGTFADVMVENVPVGPSGPAEASQWALALAIARVTDADAYCSREGWAREWGAAVSGTPLEPGAGKAPTLETITNATARSLPGRTRWLLAAASDLAVE
jgi:hypothetical protein